MQSFSKTLVLLLLGAVITAPLAAQGFRPDPASHERPAGCHDDDGNGNIPAPGSNSHTCCVASHHPAILQQNSASQPLPQDAAAVESSLDAAVADAFDPFPSSVVASGGPPVMSPLRV
jgi:hypothetical protein